MGKGRASETSSPPTPKTVATNQRVKMRRILTQEEKQEMEALYLDRRPVKELAARFGISQDAVYKHMSAIGVKRGQQRRNPEADRPDPEIVKDGVEHKKPKRERTSALEKPWYLKK